MKEKTERIRELNDQFRQNMPQGKVVLTPGILTHPQHIEEILNRILQFDDFTTDNDPHQEHDFGNFYVDNVGKIFWKMDYYNRDMTKGSEDPSDAVQTTRIMTIMLASEY